jgi:hypothetical protein
MDVILLNKHVFSLVQRQIQTEVYFQINGNSDSSCLWLLVLRIL